MKRPSRKALIIGGVVAVVAALGVGGGLLIESSRYVSTDNAQVDGKQIQINAPATGTIVDWRANLGVNVRDNQAVGRVEMQGSGAQPQQVIRAPGDGTVALDDTVNGQYVTAGQRLATAYDQGGIYVTARVDETDVSDVHIGAPVDIEVDAYPSAHVTGVVTEIQDSSAGVFSLFPESNSSGNFQKVTQVIPVKIAFTNTDGVELAPGMNVYTKIHKES
jgi:multidrug resistance efflux pump